jgi:hypothetical protein
VFYTCPNSQNRCTFFGWVDTVDDQYMTVEESMAMDDDRKDFATAAREKAFRASAIKSLTEATVTFRRAAATVKLIVKATALGPRVWSVIKIVSRTDGDAIRSEWSRLLYDGALTVKMSGAKRTWVNVGRRSQRWILNKADCSKLIRLTAFQQAKKEV